VSSDPVLSINIFRRQLKTSVFKILTRRTHHIRDRIGDVLNKSTLYLLTYLHTWAKYSNSGCLRDVGQSENVTIFQDVRS